MSHQKRTAGGFDITTADNTKANQILPRRLRCQNACIRLAHLLANLLRGLA